MTKGTPLAAEGVRSGRVPIPQRRPRRASLITLHFLYFKKLYNIMHVIHLMHTNFLLTGESYAAQKKSAKNPIEFFAIKCLRSKNTSSNFKVQKKRCMLTRELHLLCSCAFLKHYNFLLQQFIAEISSIPYLQHHLSLHLHHKSQ